MIPVVASILLALVPLPAHAAVIDTAPGDGDTIQAQPGTISVTANEDILAIEGADGANAMRITDAAGLFYGDGCVDVSGPEISAEVELGAAGDYTVVYQLVSADGHAIDGTFSFAYEPAAGEPAATGLAEAPVCGQAAPAETSQAAEPTSSEPATTEPAATEPAETDDAAAPVATSDAAPTEAPEDGQGGDIPFLAIGILATLAVLAVIAYTINRGSRARRADREGL